jgi:hypothetical protein
VGEHQLLAGPTAGHEDLRGVSHTQPVEAKARKEVSHYFGNYLRLQPVVGGPPRVRVLFILSLHFFGDLVEDFSENRELRAELVLDERLLHLLDQQV